MPLDPGVSALLTHEYDRFWQGVQDLNPDTRTEWAAALHRATLKEGETPPLRCRGGRT